LPPRKRLVSNHEPAPSRSLLLRPLPAGFLADLAGHDEVLVTSRERLRQRSVRMWFVVAPPGVIYLFTEAYSLKARRWERDPWVRLRIPGTPAAVEGTVNFVGGEELDAVAPLVAKRWADWGVTHPEGLRRMVAGGTHALLRVEGSG
jgi:hypothetical protein